MAATYVEIVRRAQPAGPYAIAGYSFGGLVAFEMARRLARSGADVEWLGLLDSNVHHASLPPVRRWLYVAGRPLRALHVRVGLRTRIRRYRSEGVAPWATLATRSPEVSPLLRRQQQACWAAFDAYRPGRYLGDATFIASAGPPDGDGLCRPLPAWRRLVRGELTVQRVPGGHEEFIREPNVSTLAEVLAVHLGD
jgi:acetoacetyl-CoA synthetase